jgi:hypothetical protein
MDQLAWERPIVVISEPARKAEHGRKDKRLQRERGEMQYHQLDCKQRFHVRTPNNYAE